eukprot:tig00020704_g13165.t1
MSSAADGQPSKLEMGPKKPEDKGVSKGAVIVLVLGFILPLVWFGGMFFILPSSRHSHRKLNRRFGWASIALAIVVIPVVVGVAVSCAPRVVDEYPCPSVPRVTGPGPYCPDCGPWYAFMVRQIRHPCEGGCKVQWSRNSWSFASGRRECVPASQLGAECLKNLEPMGYQFI